MRVASGAVNVFITTLDASTPSLPNFSAIVAAALNGLAGLVNPYSSGTFVSPFARLSFREKEAVFQIMDSSDELRLLGSLLPLVVAFVCYSEAGIRDASTRTRTARQSGV